MFLLVKAYENTIKKNPLFKLVDEFLKNNPNWYKGKRKNKLQSDEKRRKISEFRKNTVLVYKDDIAKYISINQLNEYLEKGYYRKLKGGKNK